MGQKKVLCFYLLVLVALLPLMCLRDFTPANELRYLSIADEALREGHWFAFTYHGAIYADKPPLYLWLLMLCRVIFGLFAATFFAGFTMLAFNLLIAKI